MAFVHLTRMSQASGDIALLACALFLQRFSFTFGHSWMSLDVVPAVFILVHQFLSGRLLIQYDRLLCFLVLGLAVTCSLLLNFNASMLPSYCLFIVMYFLFALRRPSTAQRYKSILLAFQFLAAIFSCLAVAQFAAQSVVNGRDLISFYGIFPEFLLTNYYNTIIPLTDGSSLIKSNGIFLLEPSTLSQTMALGILIEVLEFRRPRYLLVLALGLLFAYSGTGLMILLLFLPFAGLPHRKAALSILLVVIFVVGLLAAGIIDPSIFLSRVGEFEDTRTSGFQRFIAPFWMTVEHFDKASLSVLLLGSGPGTTAAFSANFWYSGNLTGAWIKMLYEYGLIGSVVFICFLASCFKASRCPGVLLAAILYSYVFLGGQILSTPFLIMMIVLCTLSGSEPRRGRIDTARFRFTSSANHLALQGGGINRAR